MIRAGVTRASVVVAFAATALLGGGTASASEKTECAPPGGRAICITTTDQDEVSHSVAGGVTRYTQYTVRVTNNGGSTLTRGTATLRLVDVVGGVEVSPTGSFVTSAGCGTVSATELLCEVGNLAAGGSASFGPFIASTSTDENADMRLLVTVTVNERSDPKGTPDPSQTDSFTSRQTTSLEPRDDYSASIVFEGGSTVLSTTPGFKRQSTVFAVPGVVTNPQLVELQEYEAGESGYFCPAGFSCFGQSIRTGAPGIFSATNLATFTTTLDLALLPKGVTEKSLRVHHSTRSLPITTACNSTTAPTNYPCRTVTIDRKAGIVTILVFDDHQGDWGFS